MNEPLMPPQYGIVERASAGQPARLLMTIDDPDEARQLSAEMRSRGIQVDVIAING